VKFLDRLILIANLGVIVMTFFAYLAPHVNPNYTWALSFFGFFYPVLILANFFFILYWVFRKWTRIWPSAVCLILGYNQFFGFMPFNAPHGESEKDQIKIVNYNISNALYAYDKDKSDKTLKRNAMVDFIKEIDEVGIFCFQEVGDYGMEVLKLAFAKGYHFHNLDKGAVIVSKYPIIKKGEIDFGTKTNSCLWADIRTPYDTVRVYSFHLQSNQISRDAEKLANQTEIDQKKAWYDIRGMLSKVKNRHLKRAKQVKRIADHVSQSKYKVLLGGDLNDPPQSFTYHTMSTLGNDAYRTVGSGIGTTYNGIIPLLRIDYMFVDPRLDIHSCKIIKSYYSDHFPVVTTVEWPTE
jgi:endonuclease/exonuclease/phosphatase family metal-dependent hydrolase